MDRDQLIAWLQKQPNRPVFLAQDAEGNMFSPLTEASLGLTIKGNEDKRTEELFEPKDVVDEYDPDEAVLDNFSEVITLYPL